VCCPGNSLREVISIRQCSVVWQLGADHGAIGDEGDKGAAGRHPFSRFRLRGVVGFSTLGTVVVIIVVVVAVVVGAVDVVVVVNVVVAVVLVVMVVAGCWWLRFVLWLFPASGSE